MITRPVIATGANIIRAAKTQPLPNCMCDPSAAPRCRRRRKVAIVAVTLAATLAATTLCSVSRLATERSITLNVL
jgi:hypothetical protein